MADVWANSMACYPRATCHIAGCCHLANSMSWFKSHVSHCTVLPPGEFNGMSSQSHVSHSRVLPLDEFAVMIPEPHATLQGVRIPLAILKIVFRHFCVLVQFGLWRATAFVSSPIQSCLLADHWQPDRCVHGVIIERCCHLENCIRHYNRKSKSS